MAVLLYLVVLPLLTFFPICSGASPWQIMTTGSHIRGEDHDKVILLSPDATFSCGFHEVGTNALTFSIWYTTSATERTVVWTANPYSAESGYSPVNKYGSRVSLNRDGNLILTDTNGSTVWESKTSSGKHTTVTLLDSGNLVINDSSNKIVWQSFHSPTDTLLPGQNEHCRRSWAEREGADSGRAAARRATAWSLADAEELSAAPLPMDG